MKPRDELEALLEETGELTEVRALAAKKILAADIALLMKRRGVSKAQLARRMGTARPVIDRLLDPRQPGVTLTTLAKAASVLGGPFAAQDIGEPTFIPKQVVVACLPRHRSEVEMTPSGGISRTLTL